MRLLLLIVWLLYGTTMYGQKIYVWCPQRQILKPRIGFLEGTKIKLVVFDARSIAPGSKIKCESGDLAGAVTDVIKLAYPQAIIELFDESAFYKKPDSTGITIKIAIANYQAGFGLDVTVAQVGSSSMIIPKGEWNGLVSYSVQVFDGRTTDKTKDQRQISELTSKPNMLGTATAKKCLEESFTKANQALFLFLDESLMER